MEAFEDGRVWSHWRVVGGALLLAEPVTPMVIVGGAMMLGALAVSTSK